LRGAPCPCGYPPFSFNTTAQDDGIDPARYSIEEPGELNRWLPLLKWYASFRTDVYPPFRLSP